MSEVTSRLRSKGAAVVSYGAVVNSGDYDSYDPEQTSATTLPTRCSRFCDFLCSEIDPNQVTFPLAGYCFMTGFLDAISFSAIFVWCGFQTGNFVQLTLALARILDPMNEQSAPRRPDQQALCSLLSFNAGAFLGRIGDRLGTATRRWLVLATFLQTLFTMGAAIAVWKSTHTMATGVTSFAFAGETFGWTDIHTFLCVGFVSASLGLQGIVARRLNTQFAATIVLTTVWVELMADPSLFKLGRPAASRDHKFIFLISIFLGTFVGWVMLNHGVAEALGVATVLRFFITFSWLLVPEKGGQKTDVL